MKKIFSKLIRFLLIAVIFVSDLVAPIKAEAISISPSTSETLNSVRVGIDKNQNYFDIDSRELDAQGNPRLNEGDVVVTKSVEEIDNQNGKYRIDFNITGKETTESILHPLYSVIVLDTSDSMNVQKMKDAQNALKNYSNILENGVNNFALVLFNEESGASYFNKGRWNFNTNKIGEDELPGIGNTAPGTRYMKGLNEAKKIIDNARNNNQIPEEAKVIIVFISDGSPHDATYLFNQAIPNNIGKTDTLIPKQALTDIKNSVDEIYTIGYDLIHEANSNRSEAILRNISTDLMNNYIEADDGKLATKIQSLANELKKNEPASNIKIKEIPSTNFKLSSNEINEKDIELDGNTISFNIEIKDKNIPTGIYPTNDIDNTTLTYIGIDGQQHIVKINKSPTIKWIRPSYNYTINYYKDSVNINNKLGQSNSNIELSTIINENDIDKSLYLPEGYELNRIENIPLTITDNEDSNIINVIYTLKNFDYSVHYYFNSIEDINYIKNNTAAYNSQIFTSNYYLNSNELNNKYNDYFIDPSNSKNTQTITIGANDNRLDIYYINTSFNEESINKCTNTEIIDDPNQQIDYEIVYHNSINNVKEGDIITTMIVDYLPLEIDETKSQLNGGIYDKNNKTITWNITYNIDEYTKVLNINEKITFKVIYKDIENSDNKIINIAKGITKINSKESNGIITDGVEIPIELTSKVNKIYEDTKIEELPPQTGFERGNIYYFNCIFVFLLFLLCNKKRLSNTSD